MAGDLLTKDLIAYDPLSETTRKERTGLLGLSMLGVALVTVPLVPEKFALLGIEFAKVQQGMFVRLYAVIVAYYLVAFCIYAFTDYVAWRRQEVITHHEYDFQRNERKAERKINFDELLEEAKDSKSVLVRSGDLSYTGFSSYGLALRAAQIRAAFEFLLPIAFAIYTLYELLSYK